MGRDGECLRRGNIQTRMLFFCGRRTNLLAREKVVDDCMVVVVVLEKASVLFIYLFDTMIMKNEVIRLRVSKYLLGASLDDSGPTIREECEM